MMAMIEDQKEDQWWDLETEGPEVKEEKPEEKNVLSLVVGRFCSNTDAGGLQWRYRD